MREKAMNIIPVLLAVFFTMAVVSPRKIFAHCDTMDGPVVKAAERALESGNINLVLIWIQKKDEQEIKKAFQKTLAVRKLSPEARELADMYFFETLVRIHRAGEGAPYTGLKPAGYDQGPAVPAADKAVDENSEEELSKFLKDKVHEGIQEMFQKVISEKNFDENDVGAGRKYVKAYVEFIHYVKRIYEAAEAPAGGHFPESTEGEKH
ncbi:MAG: DUF6448 family protein [Candidatus Aminicenantes bacterium]